tara:strand:+ start:58 stop:762 length:705 start_codon:yes stop_codon:yes gene_type:complete
MSQFTSFKRRSSGERTEPIPIARTVSDAMNIPGMRSATTSNKSNYSQSLPPPRILKLGSLPNPTSMNFEKMPTLELPPSFKEDEIHQNFSALGTSLGSAHRGYAASCPAPSFMSHASSNRRRRAADDQSTSSSGGGSYGEPDAQTPSYNTPSMGSRTVLSVIMERTETTEHPEDKNQNTNNKGTNFSNDVNMTMPINLQKLDLASATDQSVPDGDEDEPMPDGDDDDDMFQMDA